MLLSLFFYFLYLFFLFIAKCISCSTNHELEGLIDDAAAVPVLLVDGYNVCGYWLKLKKHFLNGKLELARQKLIDELITFSIVREVKVVVVFDAMMSGFPNHKEYSSGIDIVFSADSSADTWIEKEVCLHEC